MRTAPRPAPSRRGQALIILFGVLFLGGAAALAGGAFVTGSSSDQIDRALEREVADPTRRRAARRVVESWGKDAERFLENMQERRSELVQQFQRHDAQRAAIDALLARQDEAVDEMTRRVLDYRFELRDHLEADEWRAVFAPATGQSGTAR